MTPSERLIAGTGSISSPPVIYDRLIRVINDQRARAADAGRVISEDPGLTARLLRTVNSAMFAFPQPIESVSQAVTVVGTRQIILEEKPQGVRFELHLISGDSRRTACSGTLALESRGRP
jgi:c-di-GMP-related signal transduction protein